MITWRAHGSILEIWRDSHPSSYYAEVSRGFRALTQADGTFGDRLILRVGDTYPLSAGVTLILHAEGGGVMTTEGDRRYSDEDMPSVSGPQEVYEWTPTSAGEMLGLVRTASESAGLLSVRVSSSGGNPEGLLTPNAAAWQTWQPTGLPGLEFMWASGYDLHRAAVAQVLHAKGLLD